MNDLFRDINGSGAAVVRHAIESARHASTAHLSRIDRDRTDAMAESRTLIRAIVSLIDPPLYWGVAYGLMRGNRPHRELFERVETIIERAAAFPDYDTDARTLACNTLADLALSWPTDRDAIMAMPRQSV